MGLFFQSLKLLITKSPKQATGRGDESFEHFNQQVHRNLDARINELITGCCEAIQKCCAMKYRLCSSSCISARCCPQ